MEQPETMRACSPRCCCHKEILPNSQQSAYIGLLIVIGFTNLIRIKYAQRACSLEKERKSPSELKKNSETRLKKPKSKDDDSCEKIGKDCEQNSENIESKKK